MIVEWIEELSRQLLHSRQRQLVVFQGPRDWCDASLDALARGERDLRVFSNRATGPKPIEFSKADTQLGGETGLAVVDLFDGFNPDVLCVAAGQVRAGGILLLLAPDPPDRELQNDRYARWQDDKRSPRARFADYFFELLARDESIGIFVTPQSPSPNLPALPRLTATRIDEGVSLEQRETLDAIESWLSDVREGTALLCADRGRGKSSCLGILVERLRSRIEILVTANSRQSAALLLERAPGAEFMSPDRLLIEAPRADLLVVDEAATIPLPMLRRLGRLYPRILMATTTGGYEGTGQGFLLRFVASLEKRGLKRLELRNPVRWCEGDLLEDWLNRSLLLRSATESAAREPVAVDGFELRLLDRDEDTALLCRAHELLSSAHYRTRPSDLRSLMENPDLEILVALHEDRPAGVALLNAEGGFDAELCEQVFLGQRRPRGHLLAQMLTAQAGVRKFARYRGLRVQRIAVAPAYRRRGLGSRLFERALRFGRENAFDYIGASFALDPETAPFWRRVGCRLVHVGYAPGKSSGHQSVAVLKPIGKLLDDDFERLRTRLRRHLANWLTRFLQNLDAAQVVALLRLSDLRFELDRMENDEIEAFVRGHKGFGLCFVSLQKYVMHAVANSTIDCDELLIEKALQNRAWDRLERESGSEGKAQLQRKLRALVGALAEERETKFAGKPHSGYDSTYEHFDSPLMRRLRAEALDEDIGQHSWITGAEIRAYLDWLALSESSRFLDFGCGPGGPLTFLARETGAAGVGVDLGEPALALARRRCEAMGLAGKIGLLRVDAARGLASMDQRFDAIVAFDVVLHLQDRLAVMRQWRRLLKPGGRLLFTDAGVLTGVVSEREVALRSANGFTCFAADGYNEQALRDAGFRLCGKEDQSAGPVANASGRIRVRSKYRDEFVALEGAQKFEREQAYLETMVALYESRALSRFVYRAQPAE